MLIHSLYLMYHVNVLLKIVRTVYRVHGNTILLIQCEPFYFFKKKMKFIIFPSDN